MKRIRRVESPTARRGRASFSHSVLGAADVNPARTELGEHGLVAATADVERRAAPEVAVMAPPRAAMVPATMESAAMAAVTAHAMRRGDRGGQGDGTERRSGDERECELAKHFNLH